MCQFYIVIDINIDLIPNVALLLYFSKRLIRKSIVYMSDRNTDID